MGLTTHREFEERKLTELRAKTLALALREAGEWEDAIDWGDPDDGTLRPPQWRGLTASEST